MANKYTALAIPSRDILEKMYTQENMTQEEIGIKFNTTQKVVYTWFKKLEIKSRIPKKRNQFGEKNSYWKGDDATYAAFHYRVEACRGKPHYCSACGTMDKNRYEWANLTGKYSDVNDYARMCVSCHRKYDIKRRLNINKNTINVKRKKQTSPR
jgi:transposase